MSEMRAEDGPVQIGEGASKDIVVAYASIPMPSGEDLSVMYGIPDSAKNGEEASTGIADRLRNPITGAKYPLIHLTPWFSGRPVRMHIWEGEEYQRDGARCYIEDLIKNHGCVRGLILADMSRIALTTRTNRLDNTVDVPYDPAYEMKLRRQRESNETHPRSTETSKAKYNRYTPHESNQIKREVMATWEKVKEAREKTSVSG